MGNSNDFLANIKYYGKFIIIIVVIFILLKFIMNVKIYEALLLSLIVTVSILIIENIIYVNDIASDPLNCDQCKVNISEMDNNTNLIDLNINNLVPNPLAGMEMEQEQIAEPFISDTIEKIMDNISSSVKKDSAELSEQIENNLSDDIYELKCIKTNKSTENTTNNNIKLVEEQEKNNIKEINYQKQLDELKNSLEKLKRDNEMLKKQQNQENSQDTNLIEGFGNMNELENFISNQKNQNKNLTNKLKSEPKIQANIEQVKNTIKNSTNNDVEEIEESLENPILSRAGLLNKPEQLDELGEKPKLNPNAEYNLDSPITYDAGYVQYQQDGLQKEENDVSFNNKLFKMGIGQQNIVKPFIGDGNAYYNRIQSYSSQSPTPSQALNSELKYGDYNYIGPLNSGMTNSDYTFVSPNNWYPVPPHPPVCVTNKQCTTCPVTISDGQDYMQWATLEDFDKARRFTGNMGINIDYVKNVLNNDEGY